jgi:chlorophyll/bacteriochlorophyll a synthase
MSISDRSALMDVRPAPAAVLELLKPITWFPPMWAFACGAVSSGVPVLEHRLFLLSGLVLSGPLLCAASQAINDWFDRDVDAINEPQRPIPSGRVPGRWGLYLALAWSGLSLAWAAVLGPFLLCVACFGLVLAWLYSAPPVRLKQNGWWGNLACGLSYEGFAWIAGAALMLGGRAAESAHWGRISSLALLYSLGAHGIMTLNDFKSIGGDRSSHIGSLPVRLGADRAARLACMSMAIPQVIVIVLLSGWGAEWHAITVGALLGAQVALMRRLLEDPRARAPWYNGTGVSLYVTGMMISAFAARGIAG